LTNANNLKTTFGRQLFQQKCMTTTSFISFVNSKFRLALFLFQRNSHLSLFRKSLLAHSKIKFHFFVLLQFEMYATENLLY